MPLRAGDPNVANFVNDLERRIEALEKKQLTPAKVEKIAQAVVEAEHPPEPAAVKADERKTTAGR